MKRSAILASFPLAIVIASVDLVSAETSDAQARASCEPAGDVAFVCEQHHPEDLIRLPGAPWVVASGADGRGLTLIDVRDRSSHALYPAPNARVRWDRSTYGKCPGAPGLNAPYFGLAVRPGRDGTDTIYAVSFGQGTETSVQVFELQTRDTLPFASWIGCVIAPDEVNLNSVAPLPHGGFVASNFSPFSKNENLRIGLERTRTGVINGQVWEWHSGTGWARIPGTESSGANGVEISEDGKWLYIDEWGSRHLSRVALGRQPLERKSIAVDFRIDNVHWAPDRHLLAAGQGADDTRIRVVKIDPKTLQVTDLINRPIMAGFGNCSGAAQVDDRLWVTSFQSDRIAIFPLPK